VEVDVVASAGDRVAVHLRWRWSEAGSDERNELFQVFTLRDGRVVRMQDHLRRREAVREVMKAA